MHFTHEPKRTYYVFAIMISIFLGLASRYINVLPNFIVNHTGDTLWAIMVYFLFRFIFASKSHNTAFYLSFIFCFSIEFSQLYQADWINTIRSTMLGSLILGKGFLAVDLKRYSIGIVIAFMMDKWIPSLFVKVKNKQL
ncbi:DUF2809 domain-containing protein [Psychrobacillus antarcticus]|uniref:ribosomal maturation YjgA family protein n=1 Tax=Psychrobacillus antarcticus TaxID=2879115 RepID=UPI0024079862|nr:DUF2809 domain-containing protein [Psychrobacillus antarcticus]